jgi:uncharacterized Tic20 family protein
MPPQGWYHDGYGQRWWDGTAWGPYAPAATESSDDKTFSILTHGGVLVGGFILPLVFYLISDDRERPETRWHSREALNFQITFIIVYFAAFILMFLGFGIGGVFGGDTGAGAGIGIGFAGFFLVAFGAMIANFVFSIIGAVKANNGIRWKYPIRIPFVRG